MDLRRSLSLIPEFPHVTPSQRNTKNYFEVKTKNAKTSKKCAGAYPTLGQKKSHSSARENRPQCRGGRVRPSAREGYVAV